MSTIMNIRARDKHSSTTNELCKLYKEHYLVIKILDNFTKYYDIVVLRLKTVLYIFNIKG
jgi:hypothetical protein